MTIGAIRTECLETKAAMWVSVSSICIIEEKSTAPSGLEVREAMCYQQKSSKSQVQTRLQDYSLVIPE